MGNLDAKRDWGYSPDYVEVMWLMLQQDTPDDYVVATGETHSIRKFLSIAFNQIGIDDYEKYIEIDKRYMRPAEVEYLRGDSGKARKVLGWKPKTSLEEMISKMIENDINKHKGLK